MRLKLMVIEPRSSCLIELAIQLSVPCCWNQVPMIRRNVAPYASLRAENLYLATGVRLQPKDWDVNLPLYQPQIKHTV